MTMPLPCPTSKRNLLTTPLLPLHYTYACLAALAPALTPTTALPYACLATAMPLPLPCPCHAPTSTVPLLPFPAPLAASVDTIHAHAPVLFLPYFCSRPCP